MLIAISTTVAKVIDTLVYTQMHSYFMTTLNSQLMVCVDISYLMKPRDQSHLIARPTSIVKYPVRDNPFHLTVGYTYNLFSINKVISFYEKQNIEVS